ncbi:MipA/OmpV family protein [Pseudohoeflea suaedae]|nr:MipA/OmpV family protein [Pseudohoeflea suaedae]
MIKPLRSASLALALLLPATAHAQDSYGQAPGIDFELGLGAGVSPEYFGSSSYILSPVPVIRIQRLTLPNGRTFGGGPETGFSIGPSFDFIGKRSASDHPVLAGLDTVDAAVELGLSASYTFQNLRVSGDIRHGFGGHHGIRGEVGVDALFKPTEKLAIYAGPRFGFADDEFTNTYFGVSAAEAAVSAFPETAVDGGLLSTGLEVGARYDFNDTWAAESKASWSRLQGDAGDSPITAQGSRDQYGLSFALIRKFSIDF